MSHGFDYKGRRRNALWRIQRLRELDAPTLIVRNEQMLMWGLRQYRRNRNLLNTAMADLPGWQDNHRKFIAIHEHKNRLQ